MATEYLIREVTEETVHTTVKTAVLGGDGKPVLDGQGREVVESKPATIRHHLVRYTLKDESNPLIGEHGRLFSLPLTLTDADTLSTIRAKAESAVKSAHGL